MPAIFLPPPWGKLHGTVGGIFPWTRQKNIGRAFATIKNSTRGGDWGEGRPPSQEIYDAVALKHFWCGSTVTYRPWASASPPRQNSPPPPCFFGNDNIQRFLGKNKEKKESKWMEVHECFNNISHKSCVARNINKIKRAIVVGREIIDCLPRTPNFLENPCDPVLTENGKKTRFFGEK